MTRTRDRDGTRALNRLGALKAGGAALAGAAVVGGIEAVGAEASVNPATPAAGSLGGTYPNPAIAPLAVGDGMVAAGAAIAESKLALAADAAQVAPCVRSIGDGAQQVAPGTPIAVCYYGAGGVSYSRTAPFNTVVAVDATNLKVTFTAPDTGAVVVTLNAPVAVSTSSNYVGWELMEGGSALYPAVGLLGNDTAWTRQTVQLRVSGLTPGASHTYTWGWFGLGSSGTISMTANSSFWGFASMVVARCA